MDCEIVFADANLKLAFESLKDIDERLYKEIQKAILDIRQNSFKGRNVRKKLIPKILVQKYNVDNLWIYNLRKDWRLLYSLAKDEIELVAVILDWMNHKDYERLFNF